MVFLPMLMGCNFLSKPEPAKEVRVAAEALTESPTDVMQGSADSNPTDSNDYVAATPHTTGGGSESGTIPLPELHDLIESCEGVIDQIASSEDRYRSWVDWKDGPQLRSRYITYGIHEVLWHDRCIEDATEVVGASPQDAELAGLTGEFASAVASMAELVNQAHEYYAEERYRDDQLQLGRQMHRGLVTGFAHFAPLAERFPQLLQVRRKASDQARLDQLESSGDTFSYLVEKIRIAADDLKDEARRVRLSEDHLEGGERSALTTATVVLQESLEKLESVQEEDDAVHAAAQENDPDSMTDQARSMLRKAETLLRFMRRGGRLNTFERSEARGTLRGAGSIPFCHSFVHVHYDNLVAAIRRNRE